MSMSSTPRSRGGRAMGICIVEGSRFKDVAHVAQAAPPESHVTDHVWSGNLTRKNKITFLIRISRKVPVTACKADLSTKKKV